MKLIQKHTVSSQSHPDLRLRDQIKAYIRCEPEGEDDDPLSFWRSNSSKFPLLQELARDTLSQSASSVPVENMFSTMGLVNMLRRPFIFWLYSCKIWLLTLIDSPICTWWLVELFITKTGNQPITRGRFFNGRRFEQYILPSFRQGLLNQNRQSTKIVTARCQIRMELSPSTRV